MDELLTPTEAARVLKVGKNRVYDLMNYGYLPYLVLGRRKVRREALEEFMRKWDGYVLTNLTKPVRVSGEVGEGDEG